MAEGLFISTVVAFVKLMSPIVAVSAVVLFLRPTIFVDIEKRLSAGMGTKKLHQKATSLIEKENMALQQLLIQYNRMAGFFIFVLSVIVIVRLYLHVSL